MEFLYNFLNFSDTIGSAIAILFTILFGNKKNVLQKKITLLYFVIYSILSLYGNLYDKFYYWYKPLYPVDSNNWLYDNIPFIQSAILFIFFYDLNKSKTANRISIISFILVIAFYGYNWRNAINREQNLEFYLVFTIFVILNSIIYLLFHLNEISSESLFNKGEFWFVTSIVFYCSSCSIFWVFYKDLYTKYPTSFNLNYLQDACQKTIFLISCIFYSLAIYLKTRQSR